MLAAHSISQVQLPKEFDDDAELSASVAEFNAATVAHNAREQAGRKGPPQLAPEKLVNYTAVDFVQVRDQIQRWWFSLLQMRIVLHDARAHLLSRIERAIALRCRELREAQREHVAAISAVVAESKNSASGGAVTMERIKNSPALRREFADETISRSIRQLSRWTEIRSNAAGDDIRMRDQCFAELQTWFFKLTTVPDVAAERAAHQASYGIK